MQLSEYVPYSTPNITRCIKKSYDQKIPTLKGNLKLCTINGMQFKNTCLWTYDTEPMKLKFKKNEKLMCLPPYIAPEINE